MDGAVRRGGSGAAARGLLVAVAVLVLGMLVPAGAGAFDFASFDASVLNAGGTPETRAGVVPDRVMNTMMFATTTNVAGDIIADGSIKDVVVDLPPGMVGNPNTTDKCDPIKVPMFGANACPASSQIGNVTLPIVYAGSTTPVYLTVPLYNIKTPPHSPAQFGFRGITLPVFMDAKVRPGDHGISIVMKNISQALPIVGSTVEMWGIPAAKNGSNLVRKPFLVNPTQCTGKPVTTTVRVNTWQHPDRYAVTTFDNPPVTGCDRLPFEPKFSVVPESAVAGAPSGYHIELAIPQHEDPTALVSAHLKQAKVTLPEGVSISPAAADGLAACSQEQIGLGSDSPVACPQASKIGTVKIETPLLETPMQGGIYQAEQDRNPFGTTLAIYVVASSTGVTLKLPGKIEADERTGQLTTTFDDNPQLPFSKLMLDFNGGPRAPLSNPRTAGTYTTVAELTSWSGKTVVSKSTFDVTGAARGFDPSMSAGTQNPVAGAFSPLVLAVARADGDQGLKAIRSVRLPDGLLGKVASVALCDQAQAAAGSCPEAARVGQVQVASGIGATPLWIPQAGKTPTGVYLTGPYSGAPYGLSIKVPAQAGPFDLGTVVVRSALRIDSKTAAITAETDDLPTILKGIPLGVREVRLILDRAGFMFNPTSCAPKQITATIESIDGASRQVASRFQVGDCAAKPFSPIIGVSGGGKGQTARFKHPALKVTVRQSSAQAHLDKANVVLPKAFNVDLQAPALKAACAREVYAQDKCSPTAIVGTVKAITPVFSEPLTGSAFLLQKKGQLPDIVMRLSNVHYSIDLIGVLDFLKDGRVITRVSNIPDAPITSFELNIKGGKGGSLLTRSDLCAKKAATQATFKGQNGKVIVKKPTTQIAGCPKRASGGRS